MFHEQAAILSMYMSAPGDGVPEGLAKAIGTVAGSLGIFALIGMALIAITGTLGMTLWMDTAFPRAARLTYERYRTNGRRCFWIGLVNALVGFLLFLLLLGSKVLALLGLLLAAGIVMLALFGLTAAFRHLGMRLRGEESERGPLALLLGGLSAQAAFCFPILGQILMAVTLIRGLGAAILGVLAARRDPVQPVEVVVAVPDQP